MLRYCYSPLKYGGKMKKTEILKTILKSAKLYSENLENKNLIFIFNNENNETNYFEVLFEPRHFHHLTGTRIVNPSIKSKVEFYNMCLENNISEKDFDLATDGTTSLKMQILPSLMKLHRLAKMVGDYNSHKPKLYTEKLAGNIVCCMGFTKEERFYVPNTILKEDIRDITPKVNKLIAVYSKKTKDIHYTSLCYLAKGISIDNIKLPQHINGKIDNINLKIEF